MIFYWNFGSEFEELAKKELRTFDRILSTFKFTENPGKVETIVTDEKPTIVNDWQNYQDSEMGFQIMYPKEWGYIKNSGI